MPDHDTSKPNTDATDWFWSQRGATLGPVDFSEIRRLAASGSITPDTWLFDPAQQAWVAASSITGLFAATSAPPPPAPERPASVVYCRFCGATNSPFAARCASCGREAEGGVPAGGIDPKLAAIICRASILTAPLLASTIIGPAIAPAIVWAIGSREPRVVAEARMTFNCLLVLVLALVATWLFGLLGAILVVPAILAGIVTMGIAVYCIVVGVLGIVAASNGREFRYPWIPRLIK